MNTYQRAINQGKEEALMEIISGLIEQGVPTETILKAARISSKKLEKIIKTIQSDKP